ncbi:ATP-dependent DNA helicase PIF1-like, partial [Aphis craccivora]
NDSATASSVDVQLEIEASESLTGVTFYCLYIHDLIVEYVPFTREEPDAPRFTGKFFTLQGDLTPQITTTTGKNVVWWCTGRHNHTCDTTHVECEDDLPIIMRRVQFLVRLSFAMTINKSQGQTFDRVGLLLTSPVSRTDNCT